jgi:hypothetical protein
MRFTLMAEDTVFPGKNFEAIQFRHFVDVWSRMTKSSTWEQPQADVIVRICITLNSEANDAATD